VAVFSVRKVHRPVVSQSQTPFGIVFLDDHLLLMTVWTVIGITSGN
jgi:hypothetical protein